MACGQTWEMRGFRGLGCGDSVGEGGGVLLVVALVGADAAHQGGQRHHHPAEPGAFWSPQLFGLN